MKKRILPLVTLALFISGSVRAQEKCATMSVLAEQIANDPQRAAELEAIEAFTSDAIANGAVQQQRGGGTIVIPVIWHVLWNDPAENIPFSQIQEQMDQLNAYFSYTNQDNVNTPPAFQDEASAVNIQFCLAQRDPKGNPSTGVERVNTPRTSFDSADPLHHEKYKSRGGANAWPRDKYLNIWTCNLVGFADGYGTFPGGPAREDGVVMLYSEIGSIDSPGPGGSPHVTAHEVGHWLNLRHIWGDDDCGDDHVADTPTQFGPTSGCPTFPAISCSNGPDGDMFCNHMDYSDQVCINMFTAGQAARMEALFLPGGARAALLTSDGCIPGVAACPSIALRDNVGHFSHSCGATGKVVGASGSAGIIYAEAVSRVVNGYTQYPNRYKFIFNEPNFGYVRAITSTNYQRTLNQWFTNPLLCGTHVYDVTVQASYDGGATYCPVGATCTVEITNNLPSPYCTPAGPSAGSSTRTMFANEQDFAMWPNPNNGGQLYLSIGAEDLGDRVFVDIYDAFGKRVMQESMTTTGGVFNGSIGLDPGLASGIYMVSITSGDLQRTERLLLQR